MRPSRSLAAGAERAPIRITQVTGNPVGARPDQMEPFDRDAAQTQTVGACRNRRSRATFFGHALEFRDDVSAEGELRALGADPETREAPAAKDGLAIERFCAVQGGIVANFRPEGN
jgi:hypothetical protein